MEKMILTVGVAAAAFIAGVGSFMFFEDPAALLEPREAAVEVAAPDPEPDGASDTVTNPSDSTNPDTPSTNDPQPEPEPVVPPAGGGYVSAFEVSYEQYQAMSAADQQAWFESFETVEAFFDWYNAAKAEYEEHNSAIVIGGDGVVDMSQIVG